MTKKTKILIGVAVVGVGALAFYLYTRNKSNTTPQQSSGVLKLDPESELVKSVGSKRFKSKNQ